MSTPSFFLRWGEIRFFLQRSKGRIALFILLLFVTWYTFCLPKKLFNDPCSTVVFSREGQLLSAHIAADGQWRFPENTALPFKVKECLLSFEDKDFYDHFGVSLKGVGRAIQQNFSNGRIVSGGSTITMQVIRMSRKNPARNYSEKVLEMLLATRLEIRNSKDEILGLYLSHAPFGNNVVGLDAAAWRYFGRTADQLSWAEAATLAVLPNAPGLIYPGKNHSALLAKRNRLLKRMLDDGKIESIDYALALAEAIPPAPVRLPRSAPHLLQDWVKKGGKGKILHSTLSASLQSMANATLDQHALSLRDQKIMNGAIVISSVKTGEVLAYVGNTNNEEAEYSSAVNCIQATRSSGSTLKPLLYAKALEQGEITPKMLLGDLPSKFGSFSPQNFSGQFEGAVPANQALSRSLNIPMVHLLRSYGMSRFHADLKRMGISTLDKPSSHYGLSLILGGAEVKLWEMNELYLHLAQNLVLEKNFQLHYDLSEQPKVQPKIPIHEAAIFTTFEALIEVNRPDEENNWRAFSSSQKIAWKTGTSFGFRDGWAIGVTAKYVVSVWIGNADGEGRPGLTGVSAAAPVMFDLFRKLEKSAWFDQPHDGYQEMNICRESGHRASLLCPNVRLDVLPLSCQTTKSCPYHKLVHFDQTEKFRVNTDCREPYQMVNKAWFILPATMEKFYRDKHPNYQLLPVFEKGCNNENEERPMGLLYPKPNSKIILAKQFSGERGSTVFEAFHRSKEAILYWHIDDHYFGQTQGIHQISLLPETGVHILTLVDDEGIVLREKFEIVR